MDKKLFFVVLNWNTTDLLKRMVESVEATLQGEPHIWIIVDNGSRRDEEDKLFEYFGMGRGPEIQGKRDYEFIYPSLPRSHFEKILCSGPKFPDWTWQRYLKEVHTNFKGRDDAQVILIKSIENLGCILAQNLAFDVAKLVADGQPHEIVVVDTDVEVFEAGWLGKVLSWADDHPKVGIIGMEHSQGAACAPAIFLDTFGNWYLHEPQTMIHEPVETETVGLGLALIRWPVLEASTRFDTGFKIYYKQDDDFTFHVRAALDLEIWAYPVNCVHWGSLALKENKYTVDGVANGRVEFDKVKQANQRYFAGKWKWALRPRRKDMAEEAKHLDEMKQVMAEMRGKA